jgi:hypothetical protein
MGLAAMVIEENELTIQIYVLEEKRRRRLGT